MTRSTPLPIDTILLVILGTVYVAGVNEALGALLMLPVGSYILLDTLARSNILNISPPRLFDLKLVLLMLTISLVVILPTISQMMIRQAAEPWQYVHDGTIQIEESIKYLLQAKNPYTEDYLRTSMAQWEYTVEGVEENPALYHNAYLPLVFLFSTPVYLVVNHLTGWYDQRLVYLCLFVCTLWPLMKHAAKPSRKLSLLIVFGLNFLAAPYMVEGRNDSFVMFWLILSTYLLQKDKITLSALSLGLACASKQTAWLFVPFFLVYVWGKAPSPGEWTSLRKACPLFLVPLLVILPFLLWDAAAFLDDTYWYLSGQAVSSYPIRGFGFGGLLLTLGFIRDRTIYFPFIIFQAALCLPLLIFLLRRQSSENTVKRCWLGYGLLLLTFAFFSRFFNDNHLGIVVNALALGLLSEDVLLEA
jgi:uncharacterized membrane protein